MATSIASLPEDAPQRGASEVSLLRLYVLRALYLLLIVGLGATMIPALLSHEPDARGVIPSLLGALWLLAFVGLRYPLQMLPLLLFEFVWKTIWLVDFGLQQWLSGPRPPTFDDDFFAIGIGVLLMPLVIPWGFVWRHYVIARSERWR